MIDSQRMKMEISGGCLCGGVRYRVRGPARQIIDCHCENCRRTHGHYAAYTAVDKDDMTFEAEKSLKWFHDALPDTYRGFCDRCGSSLFWDARRSDNIISIAAGSLNPGHGLKTLGHIYLAEAGEYYEIDDGLPRFEYSNKDQLDPEFYHLLTLRKPR